MRDSPVLVGNIAFDWLVNVVSVSVMARLLEQICEFVGDSAYQESEDKAEDRTAKGTQSKRCDDDGSQQHSCYRNQQQTEEK